MSKNKSVPFSYQYFGHCVSISGNTAVVGAYYGDRATQDDDLGVAYVFVRPGEGWGSTTETATLTTSDTTGIDDFGKSVAISGDTVVVGANRANGAVNFSGSAYVFEKPGGDWTTMTTHTAELNASDGAADDEFGYSVAISGDTVVVGAFADDDPLQPSLINPGAAYVFEKPAGGWSGTLGETAKLTSSTAVTWDQFGYTVAVSGDTVAVAGTGGNGPVNIFEMPGGGWIDMTESATMGYSSGIAIDGNTLVCVHGISDYGYVFQDLVQWTLSIAREGNGNGTVTSTPEGIDCGSDCDELLDDSTSVTLLASPENGSVFQGWSGDADCEDGIVTMKGDVSCTARFGLKTVLNYLLLLP